MCHPVVVCSDLAPTAVSCDGLGEDGAVAATSADAGKATAVTPVVVPVTLPAARRMFGVLPPLPEADSDDDFNILLISSF